MGMFSPDENGWVREEEYNQLKAENEDLKQECDLYKTWYRAKHDDLKNFLWQLKESNKTLNKMLLILNDRLEEYKRIYGEL